MRTSSEDQAEKETIENQWQFAEASRRVHCFDWAKVYRDDGVRGATALEQRPEGRRLLEDLKRGEWDTLYVFNVKRLGRNLMAILRAVELLDQHGASLKSLTEPFDTSTHIGRFILSMLGSVAQLDRDNILELTELGHARAAREGRWNGGQPPAGYKVEDRRLAVHEPEAVIVRELFRLYLDGLSTMGIADYLNARGVPTISRMRGSARAGERWKDPVILQILSNSTYAGEQQWRKRRVLKNGVGDQIGTLRIPEADRIVGSCVPLVSREVWDAVQVRRRTNAENARRNAKRDYLLRNLIRCLDCGYRYVGHGNSANGKAYHYYSCRRRADRGPTCFGRSIPAAELEELVWTDIEAWLRDPGPLLEQLERQVRERVVEARPLEDEAGEIDQALQRLDDGRQRVLSLYRRGVIGDQDVEAQLRELVAEGEVLQDRRTRIFGSQVEAVNLETRLIEAGSLLRSLQGAANSLDYAGRRNAVKLLVEQVTVKTTGEGRQKKAEIEVQYLFEGPSSARCPNHVLTPTGQRAELTLLRGFSVSGHGGHYR